MSIQTPRSATVRENPKNRYATVSLQLTCENIGTNFFYTTVLYCYNWTDPLPVRTSRNGNVIKVN